MKAEITQIENGWLLEYSSGFNSRTFHYDKLPHLITDLKKFLEEDYPAEFEVGPARK